MMPCCIGLGANLGDPHRALIDAAAALDRDPRAGLLERSPIYRSAALGPGVQPPYLNAALTLHWQHGAEALLTLLQSLENRAARVRGERWAARTLDLDLLFFAGETIRSPRLTVPHPRIAQRNFVLQPMIDVLGEDARVSGRRLAELLAACPANPLERTRLSWHGAPSMPRGTRTLG